MTPASALTPVLMRHSEPTAVRSFPVVLAVLLTAAAGCDQPHDGDIHSGRGDDVSEGAGWIVLFNGENFDGWRGFRRADIPEGWAVTPEGEIHFTHADGDINTGIITEDQYESFELAFEWRIAPAGNSGVFFHVTEDEDAIWKTGPEYQIVDNEGHPDGESPLSAAGSNYALHGPEEDFTRPAGEYNDARIVVSGSRVEHRLNGNLVVEYDLGSPDWEERVSMTGFADYPSYGRTGSGHIALQEGGPVWYRKLRIRVLDDDASGP